MMQVFIEVWVYYSRGKHNQTTTLWNVSWYSLSGFSFYLNPPSLSLSFSVAAVDWFCGRIHVDWCMEIHHGSSIVEWLYQIWLWIPSIPTTGADPLMSLSLKDPGLCQSCVTCSCWMISFRTDIHTHTHALTT